MRFQSNLEAPIVNLSKRCVHVPVYRPTRIIYTIDNIPQQRSNQLNPLRSFVSNESRTGFGLYKLEKHRRTPSGTFTGSHLEYAYELPFTLVPLDRLTFCEIVLHISKKRVLNCFLEEVCLGLT